MPAYDSVEFQPPAPVAHVILRNPETGADWSDVPMLLDTGADVTLVPRDAVDHLGITVDPDKNYAVIGFDGGTSLAPAVRLELEFCKHSFRGQFLLTDQSWGILGRNVLNRASLLLDGPHLNWEEHGV